MHSTHDLDDAPPRTAHLLVPIASFLWLAGCGYSWLASGARHTEGGFQASVLFVAAGAPAFVAALVMFVLLAFRLVRGREASPFGILFSIGAMAGGLLMNSLFFNMWLDRAYPTFFAHGRRLHNGKKLLAPASAPGDGWIARDDFAGELPVPEAHRDGLAAQWRDNAAKEHASIAAFAHLTLDLSVVGAPARLVLAAQRAAADECRHAQLAYTIAARMDGRNESPTPFPGALARRTLAPVRDVALAQIAVDALADGALNEGLAARILARLVKDAATPELAIKLSEIATDEARHAKDSWDVIEWCAAEGGDVVARALLRAAAAMPMHLGSPLPVAARLGAWSPWGVQGATLEVTEYAVVRRLAQRRLQTLLVGQRAA